MPADLADAFSPREDQGFALVITDIHLDPLADPDLVTALREASVDEWASILDPPAGSGLSQYGSDSSYALVRSALEAAAGTGLVYDLVLVTGDYLAHEMRKRYVGITGSDACFDELVIRSELFMMHQLDEAFPHTPIIAAPGNNDAICGDYKIEPAGRLLRAVAPEWMRLTRAPEGTGHFSLGGYYSMPHPVVPDHELVVLNDIYWSPDYADACGPTRPDPGEAELLWLEWTLYRLEQQGRTATLLMHIPPGLDAYSSTEHTTACNAPASPFMVARYADRFQALLKRYAAILPATFAGHTHMDNMVVLEDASGAPVLFTKITPAVSPKFNNSPAFAVLQYDRRSGRILDEATIVLSNLEAAGSGEEPRWVLEYTLKNAYGTSEMSPATMAALAASLKSDSKLRDTFLSYYDAESSQPSSVTDSTWPHYACAQTEVDPARFASCSCSLLQTSPR